MTLQTEFYDMAVLYSLQYGSIVKILRNPVFKNMNNSAFFPLNIKREVYGKILELITPYRASNKQIYPVDILKLWAETNVVSDLKTALYAVETDQDATIAADAIVRTLEWAEFMARLNVLMNPEEENNE